MRGGTRGRRGEGENGRRGHDDGGSSTAGDEGGGAHDRFSFHGSCVLYLLFSFFHFAQKATPGCSRFPWPSPNSKPLHFLSAPPSATDRSAGTAVSSSPRLSPAHHASLTPRRFAWIRNKIDSLIAPRTMRICATPLPEGDRWFFPIFAIFRDFPVFLPALPRLHAGAVPLCAWSRCVSLLPALHASTTSSTL